MEQVRARFGAWAFQAAPDRRREAGWTRVGRDAPSRIGPRGSRSGAPAGAPTGLWNQSPPSPPRVLPHCTLLPACCLPSPWRVGRRLLVWPAGCSELSGLWRLPPRGRGRRGARRARREARTVLLRALPAGGRSERWPARRQGRGGREGDAGAQSGSPGSSLKGERAHQLTARAPLQTRRTAASSLCQPVYCPPALIKKHSRCRATPKLLASGPLAFYSDSPSLCTPEP